jgi:hypothetical protein
MYILLTHNLTDSDYYTCYHQRHTQVLIVSCKDTALQVLLKLVWQLDKYTKYVIRYACKHKQIDKSLEKI